MFLGHIGAGLAAKRLVPRTSTAVLLGAPLLLDLIWPFFLLLGAERVAIDPGNTVVTPLHFEHYPYTHSLVAAIGWSLLAGGIYLLVTRYRRGALVVGLLVLSHWVFDFVVHAPDLPILVDGPEVGLGLWNSLPVTLVIEFALFGIGTIVYQNVMRPRSMSGRIAFVALVALLILIYLGNVFGPPPPDARTVAVFALPLWLIPLWGVWLERQRVLTTAHA